MEAEFGFLDEFRRSIGISEWSKSSSGNWMIQIQSEQEYQDLQIRIKENTLEIIATKQTGRSGSSEMVESKKWKCSLPEGVKQMKRLEKAWDKDKGILSITLIGIGQEDRSSQRSPFSSSGRNTINLY